MPNSSFGTFDFLCRQIPLPLCASLQQPDPACYSRNLELGKWIIFEPGVLAVYSFALAIAAIFIWSVKRKYTAVGRKEMIYFFYLYGLDVFLGALVCNNIIPIAATTLYRIVTAAHIGCVACTFWILMLNGFVGFQWADDGTKRSLWFFRISSLAVWTTFFVLTWWCILAEGSTRALENGAAHQKVLFFGFFSFVAGCMFIWTVCQLVLMRSLDDYWAFGPLMMAFLWFAMGMALMWGLGVPICRATQHYLDGMFLMEICNLFSVMMIYKYWDTITREDLEYALPHVPVAMSESSPREEEAFLKGGSVRGRLSGSGSGSGDGK